MKIMKVIDYILCSIACFAGGTFALMIASICWHLIDLLAKA